MEHRSKRLLSILLTLALVLGLMPGMSLTAYAANTAIPIDGSTQTQDHIADQGWSYNATTHTLTLSNANINNFPYGIAYYDDKDLNIVLSGTNSISTTNTVIWSERAGISISGNGSLEATSSGGSGIYTPAAITIDGGTVNATGSPEGISGDVVTIKTGKITVEGSKYGIQAQTRIEIENGTVTANGIFATLGVTINNGNVTSESKNGAGIESPDGTVTIKGGTVKATGSGFYSCGISGKSITIEDGTVTAVAASDSSSGISSATDDVKITGGTVTATGGEKGISAEKVTISGGKVTATGNDSYGIYGVVTVKDGELTVTGATSGIYSSGGNMTFEKGEISLTGKNGYGINCSSNTLNIGSGITSFIAEGSDGAISSATNVKNAIAGTGWTDQKGTEGKETIPVSEGQKLDKFKKVQFPEVKDPATVTKVPAAKTLTFTGSAQELVTAGTADGGTMQYALGTDDKTAPTSGWSADIPAKTNAGT